jgi:xylulokinase
MGKILTIDLGTTFFKFALFDRTGRLVHICRIAPPSIAKNDRMEMSADAFSEAMAQGIAMLRNSGDSTSLHDVLADVEAVTFATQTNSFLLLDKAGQSLTPILLWPDRRAAEFETEAQRRCNTPTFTATSGVPQIDSQFMVAKLLWLQRYAAEVWDRAEKICLISDYLTYLFTGKFTTEAGAAGLTGLVDIHRCQWYGEMLDRFSIAEHRLPKIVRAGIDLGPIDLRAARRFRLPTSCRFVVGCLDQYAGAIGLGNVEPGMVSETTGTVLATVRCDDQLAPPSERSLAMRNDKSFDMRSDPAVFQGPAFRPGLYWRMAFGNVSANYLQWYRDQLPDRPTFDELGKQAASATSGCNGLKLRTDRSLTTMADVFENATPQHTRGDHARCIMEAVGQALSDQVAAISKNRPPREIRPPCEIRGAGGAARSDVWLQIKADHLGTPTLATQCEEPTSLGAAILAEAALNGADVATVAKLWVHLEPPHLPCITQG